MNLKGGRGIYSQFLLNYKEIVMARGYLAQVQKLIDEKFKDNPDGLKQKLKEIEEAKKAQLTGELIKKIEEFYECFSFERGVETVKNLIERGADIKSSVYGFTVLHIASFYNDMELIKLCLKSGIDINNIDITNRTPLHILVGFNGDDKCSDSVIFFVEMGANVNAKADRIGTPLDWAYSEEIQTLLKKHGATK